MLNVLTDFPVAQIECFCVDGHSPNSKCDIVIPRSESLYIARAIVYEADKYGTIDTQFKTSMNGFGQGGMLSAFQDLLQRLQIKFTPYLEENFLMERVFRVVKIRDGKLIKFSEESTGCDDESEVKSEDSGDESSELSSADVKVKKVGKKKMKAIVKKNVGRLVSLKSSKKDSDSDSSDISDTGSHCGISAEGMLPKV